MPTATPPTAIEVATYRVMGEGRRTEIVMADSGSGDLFRPQLTSEYGARTANLETLYDFFINNVPDPDIALIQNPDFDAILAQHPDVHQCMNIRALTVASMPDRYEAAQNTGDDAQAEKVKDYVEEVMRAIPRYRDVIRQMQNAVLMGGQGHEWIWAKVNGYARPTQAQPVHKTRFVFDRLGNMALLTRANPVWGSYVSVNPQTKFSDDRLAHYFPRGKFTYHQYNAGVGGTWSRPAEEGYLYYGRGEDVNLYIPVTFDNFVLRFQMKWLEKFGIPLAILNYPDNQATSQQMTQICDDIRGGSTVTLPRPVGTGTEDDLWKLQFVQPTGQGFEAFMEFHNNYTAPRIAKILLGGADQQELADSGAYAASVSQKDFGPMMIYRYDGQCISETLNTQLIPAVALARFQGLPAKFFPKYVLEPKEEVDREMQLGIVEQAATMVPVREDDVYEAAGISKPAVEEKTIFLGGNPMDEFGVNDNPPGGKRNGVGGMPGKNKKKPIGSKSGQTIAKKR